MGNAHAHSSALDLKNVSHGSGACSGPPDRVDDCPKAVDDREGKGLARKGVSRPDPTIWFCLSRV